MSEPVHLLNNQIVTNGDMSGDITSSATPLDEAVTYCVQATFTGAPVGTLILQATNDPILLGWTDITSSSASVAAAGSYMINDSVFGFSQVRLQYRRTSGTGTLNAKINAKRR